MLLRRLTHVVLTSALAAGCSHSLFDDGTGGGDDSPPDSTPSEPDAGVGIPDADLTIPDADLTIPDADLTIRPDAMDSCPGACFEDNAFDDFAGPQGGVNGRWRYVEYQQDTDSYADMVPVTFGGVTGFQGTGTPAPTIAYCSRAEPGTLCAEQPGTLVLTTTAPGAYHPALMWTAPEPGLYVVSVTYGTASGVPDIPTLMMLTRNTQSEILASRPLDEFPRSIDYEPMLEANDVLVLSAIAETETSVSVGVNFVILGPFGLPSRGSR
jgi:hypothetical protein